MATKERAVGMDHPTVRPANFEPEVEDADESDEDHPETEQ